jgi:hypothetical protein
MAANVAVPVNVGFALGASNSISALILASILIKLVSTSALVSGIPLTV